MSKTNADQITKELKRYGFTVTSSALGGRRYYQVAIPLQGGGIRPISQRLLASELKAFYHGVLAAYGDAPMM